MFIPGTSYAYTKKMHSCMPLLLCYAERRRAHSENTLMDNIRVILNMTNVALFVIAYILTDIFTATLVLVLGSIAAFISTYYLSKQTMTSHDYIQLVVITILGGITLIFQNALFIKLKPTLVMWGIAVSLSASKMYYKTSWLTTLYPDPEIPTQVYATLDSNLCIFYWLLGISNIFFALYTSTSVWMIYKTIGITVVQGLFLIYIYSMLMRARHTAIPVSSK